MLNFIEVVSAIIALSSGLFVASIVVAVRKELKDSSSEEI